jgi:hypothetical protein
MGGTTVGKDPLGAGQVERHDRGSGREGHPGHAGLGLVALARLGYAAAGKDHDHSVVGEDVLTEGRCLQGLVGSALDPDMAHPPQQGTEHRLAEQKLGRQKADVATQAAEQQDRVDQAGVIAGQDHPAVSWHVPAVGLLDPDEDLDAGRGH